MSAPFGRALLGREAVHAEALEPWPPGRPLCDRRLRALRVRLVPGEPGRAITCRSCLRVLSAQAGCRVNDARSTR